MAGTLVVLRRTPVLLSEQPSEVETSFVKAMWVVVQVSTRRAAQLLLADVLALFLDL